MCQRSFRRSNYPFCPLLFVYSAVFFPSSSSLSSARTLFRMQTGEQTFVRLHRLISLSISVVDASGLRFTIRIGTLQPISDMCRAYVCLLFSPIRSLSLHRYKLASSFGLIRVFFSFLFFYTYTHTHTLSQSKSMRFRLFVLFRFRHGNVIYLSIGFGGNNHLDKYM